MFDGILPLPEPPAELLDADLSRWPFFDERDLARALQYQPDDIAGPARRLWDCACRTSFPAGSLPDDDEELRCIARLKPRRFKHRYARIAALLQLTLCSDGRVWVGLAVPMLARAWGKHKLACFKGTCGAYKRWQPRPGQPSVSAPSASRQRSNGEQKSRVSADSSIASASEREKEESTHTPRTESPTEAASPRPAGDGVCVVFDSDEGLGEPAAPPRHDPRQPELILDEPAPAAAADPPPPRAAEPEPPARPKPPPVQLTNASFREDFAQLAAIWPNREALEAAWSGYEPIFRRNPDLTTEAVHLAAEQYLEELQQKYDHDERKVARFAGYLRNWLRDERWRDYEPEPDDPDDPDADLPKNDRDWLSRVRVWMFLVTPAGRKHCWPWGSPLPGDPGCEVPPYLLARPEFVGWQALAAECKADEQRKREADEPPPLRAPPPIRSGGRPPPPPIMPGETDASWLARKAHWHGVIRGDIPEDMPPPPSVCYAEEARP